MVRRHRKKHLILLLLSDGLRRKHWWLSVEVMKGSFVVRIFKVDGTVNRTPTLILLLRPSAVGFYRGTLATTRQRVILGPGRINLLLISLLLAWWGWDTSCVAGQSTWHCLKLRWPLLKSILVVVVMLMRVPELFLLKRPWCSRLLRGWTKSIAFYLKLLILCLL